MITVEIDKLTNSIEDAITGACFDTKIVQVEKDDFVLINDMTWDFDWQKEWRNTQKQVFKLIIAQNPSVIQGLISIELKKDHVFMHLIENAEHNKHQSRKYLGVAGNLVAFACKMSFELGFEGFISFISKTVLKTHYQNTLGAKLLFGDTMIIETNEAKFLVEKYFKI